MEALNDTEPTPLLRRQEMDLRVVLGEGDVAEVVQCLDPVAAQQVGQAGGGRPGSTCSARVSCVQMMTTGKSGHGGSRGIGE